MEKHQLKKITIDLGMEGQVNFKIDPTTPYGQWPRLVKFHFLNSLLILKNIGLLSNEIFNKFRKDIEEYDNEIKELTDFIK